MKKNIPKRTALLVLSGLLTFLYSCQQKEARQMPPPEIEIVNVIVQDVPIMREFVGQAYGLLDIPIRARVDGFLEELAFEEGARVKKGQLLSPMN
jgi:membrane fusion protein (multidrug efflux system)